MELLKAAPASVKLVVRYTPKVKRIEIISRFGILLRLYQGTGGDGDEI